jgi:sarcosine oxidase
MQKTWDVVVAGAGAMGSAALYQLAQRGARVLGIDRFRPPHDRGSSHGDTRITRLALGEGEQYVQFARRSHEVWRELESVTGRTLLQQVGGLVYGSTEQRGKAHGAEDFLRTTIGVAQRNAIPHEVLDAGALQARFPQFVFRGNELGCLEHTAGFVHPELCIAAQLAMAQRHGAELRTGELVTGWEKSGAGLRVKTDRGSHFTSRLILSAGSWLPGLVPDLGSQARIFRQVLFWFEIDGPHELFTRERMPVFIRVPDCGTAMFYGFPAIDGPHGGMKVAGEQFECSDAPDEISMTVSEEEVRAMHDLAAPHLPITPRCLRTVVCKYTVTPDFNFVIDRHPDYERVWLASACSGHGFKHSAAVGEALAELCLGRPSTYDLTRFKLERFAKL